MASGKFNKEFTSGNKKFKLIVEWSSTPDYVNRKANVKIAVKLYNAKSFDWSSRGKRNIVVTLGDTTLYSANIAAPKSSKAKQTTTLIKSCSGSVDYGEDLIKSANIKVVFKASSTNTQTLQKSCTFDQFESKSTITLSADSAEVGGDITVNLARSSKNVQHTITFSPDQSHTFPILELSGDVSETTNVTTKAQLIVAKCKELAYKKGTKSKTTKSKPRKAYTTALRKAFPSYKSYSSNYKTGKTCDMFVAVVMRSSGVDTSYPRKRGTSWTESGTQSPYLANNTTKFQEISNPTVSTVKPGDIIIYSRDSSGKTGHTCIVYNSSCVAEASAGDFYPRITSNLKSRLTGKNIKKLKVYRLIEDETPSTTEGDNSTFNYTIPEEALPYISRSGQSGTFTCTTYIGGVSLGSYSISAPIALRSFDVPDMDETDLVITSVPISPNTSTEYINGYSNFNIIATPTPSDDGYGRITQLQTVVAQDGVEITSPITTSYDDSYETSGYTFNNTNGVTLDGTYTIRVRAMDARGNYSDYVDQDVYISTYNRPNAEIIMIQCDAEGAEDEAGTYMKGAITGTMSLCNGYNTVNVELYYKDVNKSSDYILYQTYEDVSPLAVSVDPFTIDGGFLSSGNYLFKAVVTDKLGNISSFVYQAGDRSMLIDLGESSIGIGRLSDGERVLEVEWDSTFYGDLTCNGSIKGVVTSSSDARNKNIIANIIDDNLINIWNELQYHIFTYIGDEKMQVGLIAQEVMQLFDKYGLDWHSYGIVYGDDEEGYSINYSCIYAISSYISHLQEEKIATLETRLTELEKRL